MDFDKFIESLSEDEIPKLINSLTNKGLLQNIQPTGINKPFNIWLAENETKIPTRIYGCFRYGKRSVEGKTIGQVANVKFLQSLRYCGPSSINEFFKAFPELERKE